MLEFKCNNVIASGTMKYVILMGLALVAAANFLSAEIRFKNIYQNNMVLQANDTNTIAGWTEPDKDVEVSVIATSKDGKKAEFKIRTKSDKRGLWQAEIKQKFPKRTNLEITATSDSGSAKISNIVTGELWIGSGQSNMEWHFGNASVKNEYKDKYEQDAQNSNGDIRIFRTQHIILPSQIEEVCGDWRIVDKNIRHGDVSQVCYIFASQISKALDTPVGVINSSWGGSRIEPWISRSAFENSPECKKFIERLDKDTAEFEQVRRDYIANFPTWLEQNPTNRLQNENGRTRPRQPVDAISRNDQPTCMYNAMINGIAPLAPRGVLWYQGESNAGQPYEYGDLKKLMVNSWRKLFKRDFYFYYVELAAFTGTQNQPVQKGSWGAIREAQAEVLDLPKTGVATSIDNGGSEMSGQGDIHPPHKELVSTRLANLALAQVYKKGGEVDAISPYYKSYKIDGNKIIVKIANANGLRKMKNVDKLQGFAIRGDDNNNWKWADAEIKGDTIILSSPEVPEPKAARYAWASWPLISVESKSGLPLRPFSTDHGAYLDYGKPLPQEK